MNLKKIDIKWTMVWRDLRTMKSKVLIVKEIKGLETRVLTN